ncbi:TetR/AcrR family transcriptional regulator [Agrobacterium sp. SORGH_AS 787]|uniref:TetR/AcrR family transcriptional regulator n=1 Tax=Agrobacterium sp. SORGH_AS 787 TaxID=3041775 RepID=UPI002780D787|nr:AcrR family transcriptional regulator [Rhizobium sp. SORGH_AS_0787]
MTDETRAKAPPVRRRSIGAQRNPDSREAILRAAEAILSEKGLSAFSIEAVARVAKAGKPTIYRWWPSRAALLLDAYQLNKTSIPTPDTGSVEEDLFLFLRNLVAYWLGGGAGAIFRSVVAEAQINEEALAALSAFLVERRQQSAEMLRRAKARNEIEPWVDPVTVIETLSSFALDRLLTNRLDLTDDELRAFLRPIVRGIKVSSLKC